jgi:hypothetical protein
MTKKDKSDRQDSKNAIGMAIRSGKHALQQDPEGPGKQDLNPGNQGPHGSGEGLTGMQPGAGHPRGR